MECNIFTFEGLSLDDSIEIINRRYDDLCKQRLDEKIATVLNREYGSRNKFRYWKATKLDQTYTLATLIDKLEKTGYVFEYQWARRSKANPVGVKEYRIRNVMDVAEKKGYSIYPCLPSPELPTHPADQLPDAIKRKIDKNATVARHPDKKILESQNEELKSEVRRLRNRLSYYESGDDNLLTAGEIIAMSAPKESWFRRGLYFLIKDYSIVYIGQSGNIISRVTNHLDKKFDRIAILDFNGTEDELLEIESKYIYKYKPYYNGITTIITEKSAKAELINGVVSVINRKPHRP